MRDRYAWRRERATWISVWFTAFLLGMLVACAAHDAAAAGGLFA